LKQVQKGCNDLEKACNLGVCDNYKLVIKEGKCF